MDRMSGLLGRVMAEYETVLAQNVLLQKRVDELEKMLALEMSIEAQQQLQGERGVSEWGVHACYQCDVWADSHGRASPPDVDVDVWCRGMVVGVS